MIRWKLKNRKHTIENETLYAHILNASQFGNVAKKLCECGNLQNSILKMRATADFKITLAKVQKRFCDYFLSSYIELAAINKLCDSLLSAEHQEKKYTKN